MKKKISYVLDSRKYPSVYIKVKDRENFVSSYFLKDGRTICFTFTRFGWSSKNHKAFAYWEHNSKSVKTKELLELI